MTFVPDHSLPSRRTFEGAGVTTEGPPCASRVRPYVRTVPTLEPALSEVVLVAWGFDTAQANLALENGSSYARTFNFTVRESLTSHGTPMSAAPLVGVALRHFLRRDVTYGQAWWLVPRSAFSPRDWEDLRAVAPATPVRSPLTR